MSVLPYGARKIVYTKAKQTIDNRLAGRAAKGAIPVDRTKNSGIPRGIPLFFLCCVQFCKPNIYMQVHARNEARRKTVYCQQTIPRFDTLPKGQIPVDHL